MAYKTQAFLNIKAVLWKKSKDIIFCGKNI